MFMIIERKGGTMALSFNLIFGQWERAIVRDAPVCAFIYSIRSEVYRRQLIWFLWHMHCAEKEEQWKLFMYWMYMWQQILEDENTAHKKGVNPTILGDIRTAKRGIQDFLKFMDIGSMEECKPGYTPKEQIEGGMRIRALL